MMARMKVQLRYIEDAAARKTSFRKRRQGLLKKVEELGIMCDVVACVIVYGEDPTELLVHWPGDRADVERALWKHQTCPDMERWKRTVKHKGYVEERIEKYTEQLKKLGQSIHEVEMYHLMQLVFTKTLASSVSDNFRGFPRMFKQGNPSIATNGLPKEEVIHLHSLNDEGSDGGGITTADPYRFPGAKFEFGGNRHN